MSESADDIEIDEEGLGSVEAVQEAFAELEEESERYARTVEQFEESSESGAQSGIDSNYGSYDRETGSIYLDGMELQGSDDKIESIKEKFKEGYEGLADWSDGEWNGVTYRTDYYIEGSTLRLDTYVIEINEAVSLDSGIEQDTGSDGGDEEELPPVSSLVETEELTESSPEILGQEDQSAAESIQEVSAWSSWLETGVKNTESQADKTELFQTQNPQLMERSVFSLDGLFSVEGESPTQAETVASPNEGSAKITSQPEQYQFEEADLSVHTEYVDDTPAESITGSEVVLAEKPEVHQDASVVAFHVTEEPSRREVVEVHSPVSLVKESIKPAENSSSTELHKTEMVLTSESGSNPAIETEPQIESITSLENQLNEESVEPSPNISSEEVDSESTGAKESKVEFFQESQPITLSRNTTREANIAEVKISLPEETMDNDFLIEERNESQQITAELPEAIATSEEINAETEATETEDIPPVETSGIELVSAKRQESALKEPAETRLIETQGEETQREQKAVAEKVQSTTNRIEQIVTEVRRAIRLVKAETKKIEQQARETTQAERIYEPIREIRRVIINGPRLETGGIVLRRNRAVISTEERDRLENTNRIVEIPRYNSRRRTPNRPSAIRLAA